MSTDGLSFQQAVQEALAEEAAETADTDETISVVSPDGSDTDGAEQLPVESNEEDGLFNDFFVEDTVDGEQPPVEDSLLSFDINGTRMTLDEIRAKFVELEAGGMMKADYTRKTQEVSELRNKLKDAEVLWDALHGPNGARVATQLYNKITTGQPIVEPRQDTPDIEALVEQKVQERLAEVTPQVSQEEIMERGLRRIEAIFDRIAEDYDVELSQSDKQFVLEEAARLGTDDLPFVFDGLMARKNRLAAQRANARKNATVAPSGVEGDDEEQPTEFASFKEAAQDTLRREGMLDAVFNF